MNHFIERVTFFSITTTFSISHIQNRSSANINYLTFRKSLVFTFQITVTDATLYANKACIAGNHLHFYTLFST